MQYLNFLERLKSYAEKDFVAFQRKLIITKYEVLGVRTPVMRKIAKDFKDDLEELLSYPDEYYEVVFIKLTAISALPFERFLQYLELAVSLMDNWALCDCFKARCIEKRKEEFLPVLEGLFMNKGEYYTRYVLVSLLYYYVEEKYIPTIKEYLRRCDTSPYYVHMAAAWLTAEILLKRYEEGVAILKEGILPKRTHNKAIQKAMESYRVSKDRKEFLSSLKIK